MADKRNDGGPAFPAGESIHSYSGMTLRDWFAGQALIALRAEPGSHVWRADEAYDVADAMLAARAHGGTP